MKKHFKIAGVFLLIFSFIYAWMGDRKSFLIMLSIALEIYCLTEMEVNWEEKFYVKDWQKFAQKRYRNSLLGSLAGFAAVLCMFGFFIYS